MEDIELLCIDDILIIHREAIEMFNTLTSITINIQRLLRKPLCFGIFLPRTTVSLMEIKELDFMPQLSF